MHASQRIGIVLSFGLLAAAPPTSNAQVRAHTLSDPDAVFEEAFSLILRLREMPDGRVLVADPLGQALVLVDLATGRADTIGRVGQGPEEYRQPDAVFALPGDSTLLVDLGNARLTTLGPDGSFGPTMPIAQGEPSGPGLGGMTIVLPQAVDAQGRVYFQPLGVRGPGGGLPDSAVVLRFDRGTGAFDTVATVKTRELKRRSSGGPNNRSVSVRPVPYSPQDGWAVAPDGRIALVRSDGYYVEWIHPGGNVVTGERVPVRPVRIGRAEKEEWANRSGAGLQVGVSITNGQRQMSFGRGGGGRRGTPDLDAYDWPETKPAFNPASAMVDAKGNLWVERYGSAGSARTYDVFDATGAITARVTLEPGRRVVGFGSSTVYVVLTDEFDLQYLERYRLET